MSTVKIILVDDHEVVRIGLTTLLDREEEFEVVAQAGSISHALEVVEQHKPDVVLMDVRMPDKTGTEACRKICNNYDDTKVVMLSSYADDEAIIKSIIAGASGYILKEINSQELITAIKKVNRGESLLSPKITKKVLQYMRQGKVEETAVSKDDSLTEREREILDLIAQGMTNREIAEEVHLAEKTVRNYVSNILKKLDLNNRVEAAIYITKRKMQQKNKMA